MSTFHDCVAFSSVFVVSCTTVQLSNTLCAPLSRMNSDTVDYDDSCLIVRYLASMRPFAQSFDIYLTQVRSSFSYHSCLCLFDVSCLSA